jgi:hypothetical protein
VPPHGTQINSRAAAEIRACSRCRRRRPPRIREIRRARTGQAAGPSRHLNLPPAQAVRPVPALNPTAGPRPPARAGSGPTTAAPHSRLAPGSVQLSRHTPSGPGLRPSSSTCRARQPAQALRPPLAVHASTRHPYSPHNTPQPLNPAARVQAFLRPPLPRPRLDPAPAYSLTTRASSPTSPPSPHPGPRLSARARTGPRPLPPSIYDPHHARRSSAARPRPLDSGHPYQTRHAYEPRRTPQQPDASLTRHSTGPPVRGVRPPPSGRRMPTPLLRFPAVGWVSGRTRWRGTLGRR